MWRQVNRPIEHIPLHSDTDLLVSQAMQGDGEAAGGEGSSEKNEETPPPPPPPATLSVAPETTSAVETLPPAVDEKPHLQELEEKQELTPDEFELRIRGLHAGQGLVSNTFSNTTKEELKRKVPVESDVAAKPKKNKKTKSHTDTLAFN